MKSDHFDGRHFFNPTGPQLQPFRAVPRMLLSRRTPWPKLVTQVVAQPPPADPSGIVLTFVGHATFLMQTGEGNLLTDPVWAERAGPCGVVGPRRVRAPAIGLEDLPPIDVILLSHNHYDHCDLKVGEALRADRNRTAGQRTSAPECRPAARRRARLVAARDRRASQGHGHSAQKGCPASRLTPAPRYPYEASAFTVLARSRPAPSDRSGE